MCEQLPGTSQSDWNLNLVSSENRIALCKKRCLLTTSLPSHLSLPEGYCRQKDSEINILPCPYWLLLGSTNRTRSSVLSMDMCTHTWKNIKWGLEHVYHLKLYHCLHQWPTANVFLRIFSQSPAAHGSRHSLSQRLCLCIQYFFSAGFSCLGRPVFTCAARHI